MNITKSQRLQVVKDLRKAAELIDTDQESYCCEAILSAHRYHPCTALDIFIHLFRSGARGQGHRGEAWFQSHDENPFDCSIQQRRIIGLLLAAEIVENGYEP